jgi:hypothetical protein
MTGPPSPFGIAILFEVPWHLTNKKHTFRLELIDAQGNPAMVPTPAGPDDEGPVAIDGGFEVGRPPGVPTGMSLQAVIAINSGPLPLRPGTQYEWRMLVNGQARDDWRLAFDVRPDSQPNAGQSEAA